MDGTVSECILLHKGQEKRKVWKMELYGINRQELPKNVGNKGTCPFTFKGQWIRKALISCFGRMFDQYVFFPSGLYWTTVQLFLLSLSCSVYYQKMHIMHPKFCISLDFNLCATTVTPRRNWEKMVTKNKAERKQSVLLAIQKLRISPVDTCNIGGHVNLSLLLMRRVVNNTSKVREFLIMSVWSLHVL